MSQTCLVITPGEPAGVGPDIVLSVTAKGSPCPFVVVADPTLLEERARQLGIVVDIDLVDFGHLPRNQVPGRLRVIPVALARSVKPGIPDPANSSYVLETLNKATRACLSGQVDGLVTGPVNKEVINAAGIAFSGHTEWLAHATQTPRVVMMFSVADFRVALVTTHLPLADVPAAITRTDLADVISIVHRDLKRWFHVREPVIQVCGLNPHAGEGGYLGREEIEVIAPVIRDMQERGMDVRGPFPADTVFNQSNLEGTDLVLAMYHDQGLPVVKYRGFYEAVNITLGLPIIRTSVDHGTAVDLAGTGQADTGSLEMALKMAADMAVTRRDLVE